jgi:hypothetical protein
VDVQGLLYKCVQDALATLGEPTLQSLVWHIGNAGVPMAPKDFDICKFYVVLYEMTGGGADILVDLVARQMAAELKLEVDPGAPSLEKVLKLVRIAQKAG